MDDIANRGSSKTKEDQKKTSMRRKVKNSSKKSNPEGKLIYSWKLKLMYKTL